MGSRAGGHHPGPLPAGPADPRRGADPGPGRRRARPGHRGHPPVLERRQRSGPARRPRLLRPGPVQAPPAPAVGGRHHQHLGPAPRDHRGRLPGQLHHRLELARHPPPPPPPPNPPPPPPRLAAPPKPPAPPSAGQVTALLTADPRHQDQDTRDQVTAILGHCPALTALTPHITEFARLVTGLYAITRAGAKLDAWLDAAETAPGLPGLHSLARGIRQDYQAVRNAITLPWSSGPVEGLNTRTRLLQRQMYGRATFKLLRKRILTS